MTTIEEIVLDIGSSESWTTRPAMHVCLMLPHHRQRGCSRAHDATCLVFWSWRVDRHSRLDDRVLVLLFTLICSIVIIYHLFAFAEKVMLGDEEVDLVSLDLCIDSRMSCFLACLPWIYT